MPLAPWPASLIACLLTFACSAASAAQATGFPFDFHRTTDPQQALNELNDYRALTGLPALTEMVPDFNTGCELHNTYMQLNSVLTPSSRTPWGTPSHGS